MTLTLSDDLEPITAKVLIEVRTRIQTILPKVEVHHIGATAIAGSLTKGDLDVVLRIDPQDFGVAVDKLRTKFEVKQPQNWEPYFASFGSDTDFAIPVGVQLVIKDSEADFLLFVRDYLGSHPDALAAYNRAKADAIDQGADAYWTAKDRVLAPIVALKPKPG